jgi:hypothetical protein
LEAGVIEQLNSLVSLIIARDSRRATALNVCLKALPAEVKTRRIKNKLAMLLSGYVLKSLAFHVFVSVEAKTFLFVNIVQTLKVFKTFRVWITSKQKGGDKFGYIP